MTAPSDPLRMRVLLQKGEDHFHGINDYICFQRHRVKDFTWCHGDPGCDSYVDIEFYDIQDALLFKLTHG